jgi:hypothetical protein
VLVLLYLLLRWFLGFEADLLVCVVLTTSSYWSVTYTPVGQSGSIVVQLDICLSWIFIGLFTPSRRYSDPTLSVAVTRRCTALVEAVYTGYASDRAHAALLGWVQVGTALGVAPSWPGSVGHRHRGGSASDMGCGAPRQHPEPSFVSFSSPFFITTFPNMLTLQVFHYYV